MAEKYGTVPERFTKEWWDYFWTYYKWHVIIIALVIVTLALTIHQKITQPRYDLTIAYAGERIFSEEFSNDFMTEAAKICPDIDNNGTPSALFTQMNITETTDVEYSTAMRTKLSLAISEEDIFIYILDEKVADIYAGESKDDSCFIPLSDWYDGEVSEENAYNRHGINYGIKLSECEFFKSISSDFENLADTYLLIRYYPRKDQLKKQSAGHEAAMKMAKQFITNKAE